MLLVNISKRYKVSPEYIGKVLSIYNPSYTQKMKDLTFDEKLDFQVYTSLIHVYNNNLTNL